MLTLLAPLLLQAQGSSPIVTLIPMVLIFALFYFLIILPQRKRQRAVDEMLANLKLGDKVVTNGGLYGQIAALREGSRTVTLKISDNPTVRVEVARVSITGLQEPSEETK
jgi:preprotein translocase subunit YajC